MKTSLIKIVILSFLVVGCEQYSSSAQYHYSYPDSLSDGLDVGTLAEVNIEKNAIEALVNEIRQTLQSNTCSP